LFLSESGLNKPNLQSGRSLLILGQELSVCEASKQNLND